MPDQGRDLRDRHGRRVGSVTLRDSPGIDALATTVKETRTSVIVVPVDREARVGGYDSWWDVPVAEVSTSREVQAARAVWEIAQQRERDFL